MAMDSVEVGGCDASDAGGGLDVASPHSVHCAGRQELTPALNNQRHIIPL